jgi:hypothetical protein
MVATDNYTVSIPATTVDAIVTYYVQVIDNFGHIVDSSLASYYSDGLAPSIMNVIIASNNPNYQSAVNVYTNIEDTNPLQATALYYSTDGVNWTSIAMSSAISQSVAGRSPIAGVYQNTYHTTTYDSGPLLQLSITLFSSPGALSVTIEGNRIGGDWESIYTESGTSGALPTFTWLNPIYTQWRIILNDDITSEYYYSYEMDVEATHSATIPASLQDGNVQFYFETSDMANYTSSTSVKTYFTDGLLPVIRDVTTFAPVPETISPRVWANISDNIGVTQPILHYSLDGSSWFSTGMTLESGTIQNGMYYANIPATSSGIVSYFISVNDAYELSETSLTWFYSIDMLPTIQFYTNFPGTVGLNEDVTVTLYAVDDYGISNVTLVYTIDGITNETAMILSQGAYVADISGVDETVLISYYIEVEDTLSQSSFTPITYIDVDGIWPTLTIAESPGSSISEPRDVRIEIYAVDNAAIDLLSPTLYYSVDNENWIPLTMQIAAGNSTHATFVQSIPEIPTNDLYYFVTISDSVGLMTNSSVFSFYLETFPDADGDGLADWAEINIHGSDPFTEDTDDDGVNDYDEINVWSTNVNSNDTDGDEMPDIPIPMILTQMVMG